MGVLRELPGRITQGRTVEQTIKQMRDALWAWTDDKKHTYAAELVPEFVDLPKTVFARSRRPTTLELSSE